jgi:hypothetical protein
MIDDLHALHEQTDLARQIQAGMDLAFKQQYWLDRRSDLAARLEALPAATVKKIVCLLLTTPVTNDLTTLPPVLEGMISYEEDARIARQQMRKRRCA